MSESISVGALPENWRMRSRNRDLNCFYVTALQVCADELAEALKTMPCANNHEWSHQFGDDWTPENGRKCDCGAKGWGERFREIRVHAPEFDNHHNALLCPYCNPKKLVLVGAEARTAGGWQAQKEICICAAMRLKDGTVIRGHRHPDCFANIAQRTPRPEIDSDAKWQGQGFVTSRNRFVDRAEGMRLMAAAGAISAYTGLSLAGTKDGTPLFSEDLY